MKKEISTRFLLNENFLNGVIQGYNERLNSQDRMIKELEMTVDYLDNFIKKLGYTNIEGFCLNCKTPVQLQLKQ